MYLLRAVHVHVRDRELGKKELRNKRDSKKLREERVKFKLGEICSSV